MGARRATRRAVGLLAAAALGCSPAKPPLPTPPAAPPTSNAAPPPAMALSPRPPEVRPDRVLAELGAPRIRTREAIVAMDATAEIVVAVERSAIELFDARTLAPVSASAPKWLDSNVSVDDVVVSADGARAAFGMHGPKDAVRLVVAKAGDGFGSVELDTTTPLSWAGRHQWFALAKDVVAWIDERGHAAARRLGGGTVAELPKERASAVALDAAGARLAIAREKDVVVVDLANGGSSTLPYRKRKPSYEPRLAFSLDGAILAVGGDDLVATLDARTGAEVGVHRLDTGAHPHRIVFGPTEMAIDVESVDGAHRVELVSTSGGKAPSTRVASSFTRRAGDRWVFGQSWGVRADHRGGVTAPAHLGPVRRVRFGERGARVVTSSDDGTVVVHDLANPAQGTSRTLSSGFETRAPAIAVGVGWVALTGSFAVAMEHGSYVQEAVRVWTPASPELATFPGLGIVDLAPTPDGRDLAALNVYGPDVRVHDPATGLATARFALPGRSTAPTPRHAALAADLSSALLDGTVYDARTAARSGRVPGYSSSDSVVEGRCALGAQRVAYCIDGANVVASTDGPKSRPLFAAASAPSAVAVGAQDRTFAIARSVDGREVVEIVRRDGTVIRALAHPYGRVTALRFGPEDKRLVTGHADGRVFVWDLED